MDEEVIGSAVRDGTNWLSSMANKETQEQLGKRFAIVVGADIQDRLNVIAKEHKISQGAVVGVLMDNANLHELAPHFKTKRSEKVNSRGSKTAIANRIAKLSPEQLEKILAQLPE